MSESAEGGTGLAWRLFATLEGGSLFLATTALLAYTATYGINRKPTRGPVRTVLLTNTKNKLGKLLKQKFESCGCVVSTVTGDATSGAGIADSSADSEFKVDALIVVGAEPKKLDLNELSNLVMADVYRNLKLLEDLSHRVSRGGCIAWACTKEGTQAKTGAFSGAGSAFDAVIHAALQHIAKVCHCEAIWVRRCKAERTADRLVAELMTCTTNPNATRFSFRYVEDTSPFKAKRLHVSFDMETFQQRNTKKPEDCTLNLTQCYNEF